MPSTSAIISLVVDFADPTVTLNDLFVRKFFVHLMMAPGMLSFFILIPLCNKFESKVQMEVESNVSKSHAGYLLLFAETALQILRLDISNRFKLG